MICGSDHDHVAGKLVELHQEERYDALDFASFVDVAAFLAHGIELVEEKHARHRARIFEEPRKASIGLAEIGADQGIVPYRQQRDGDRLGDCFSERRFSVARRSRKEDAVPRLHALGAQQVRTPLLVD